VNVFGVVHSVSLSLHKFFGMPMTAGLVLTYEDFDAKVFSEDCEMVEYVTMLDRLTITGTRSGHKALLAYRILQTLKLD